MARQRFIWPDLWHDPALGRLKPDAIMLYVGCFSNADDSGRLYADPAFLRSKIFPYQDMSLRKVRALRDQVCAASRSLVLYTADGTDYLYFANWSRYQKPKYPKDSTIPAPPEEKDSGNDSGNLPPTLPEASVESEKPSPDPAPRVGLGREGKNVEEANASSSEQSPKKASRTRKPDALWDTLEREIGPAETKSERGRRNKALAELREVGATPGELVVRSGRYRRRWPDIDLTATALAANWSLLASGPNGSSTFRPESEDEREERIVRELAARGPRT